MTNEQDSTQDKKANSNRVAIILVILAIFSLLAYKIYKPKVKTSPPRTATSQNQSETASQTAKKMPIVKQMKGEKSSETTPNKQDISDETTKSIHNFLDNWKIAWQKSSGEKGNLKKYFSFYSSDFTTPKLNRAAWQKSKTIRNRGKSWIEVWLTNITIAKQTDDNFVVKFNQEYSSSNYSDNSVKKLVLHKTDQSWSITSEETLNK